MPQPTPKPLSPLAAVLAGRATTTLSPASALATRPSLPTSFSQPALRIAPAPPRADITHTGGETALELVHGFTQATVSYRNGLLEMAHYGFRLHEMDDWAAAGFAGGEQEFLSSHGLSASSWETYLLLGRRLTHLTLDQMRGISAASAKLLTKISEKLWPEFAWVEEARLLPTSEFARMVDQRVGSIGKQKKSLAEPKSAISLSVPLLQRDQLERRIDCLRRQHRLTTPLAALDFMLRTCEQGPGVVTSIERLDQSTLELERILDSPEAESEMGEATRLMNKIRRHLKELKKHANGFPGVSEAITKTESSSSGRST
jgi:hypothetical protein